MDGNIEFSTSVYKTPQSQSTKSTSSLADSQLGSVSSASPGKSFADTFHDAVHEVNKLQKQADKGMQDLSTGKTDNIPEVMMAAEKADIALKLMVQVRNKIIDAYHEVMKMQV